jgi:hypothetical protein
MRHVESKAKSMATNRATRVLLTSPTLMKEVAPMQNPHLSALETKHMVLERQISAETQRPLPDARILADLKKQKLRVKEAILAL